ncbi:MAG: thiamine pyrophosphate-dependent enzyme [Victivallaceae bacterium]|nr:thiamine pyrophosphate-dependent enzyme [Victivallaceae bacterium]
MSEKLFLSGNEAIALAAIDAGAHLGCGYPGTPSSEILENVALNGGKAEWAPNEKVALEVAIGASFAGARSFVTMKHVGLNVAADPLFTIACAGASGLVVITADDPGMASSQNEQDNRRYAVAAGVPLLEPSNSQEAYDLFRQAFALSEEFGTLVLFRVTTRVCHSKCVVIRDGSPVTPRPTGYVKDIRNRVMIPAFARVAHRNMRDRLRRLEQRNETGEFSTEKSGTPELGIIVSGISYEHAREAAPEAGMLHLKMTYPAPIELMRNFAAKYQRCLVIEEGDPFLYEQCRIHSIPVEGKPEMFRFGELNVGRVRRIISGAAEDEAPAPAGKPPQLCVGCPHRKSYEVLRDLGCIVAGDIGCYTLGVLPPFSAVDTCVCMGASIPTGLGMRHVLPEKDARRVVSVIGDSTFLHTGINGLVEMVYNRPATGHLLVILDNSTTAMTGLQEHPGTGRKLDHTRTEHRVSIDALVKAAGVDHLDVCDSTLETEKFRSLVQERLASNDLSVIICRRPCILAAAQEKKLREAGK